MAQKTKLSNAELDIVKEKYFTIIKNALNELGEDCDLATSYGKKTLVLNMPYVEQGIEGVFEICMINKTDPDFDYMLERDNLATVRAERAEKAKVAAEKKAKKIEADEKRRAVKASQEARKNEQ